MTLTDNIQTEINTFTAALLAYDEDLAAFYSGAQDTCLNFVDTVNSGAISADAAANFVTSNLGGGVWGSAVGAAADHVYTVLAMARAASILNYDKAGYYIDNITQQDADTSFYNGEAASTYLYIIGKHPTQNVIV